MAKSFNWPLWLVLLFLAVTIASVFVVRVIYQYAWTVTGNSSCIIYIFAPNDESFMPLQTVVATIAKRHALVAENPESGTTLYSRWATAKAWFDTKRPRITATLEAYPRDESDARKLEGHVSVCTVEADKTDEWKTVARDVEKTLSPLVQYKEARVQLDPRVFGACASKEHPERLATICSFQLAIPVDFYLLHVYILNPRAAMTAQPR